MRRGLPTEYANALCGVVTGWQVGDAMDRLREWGSGTLVADVLRETTHIDGTPVQLSGVTGVPRIWLLDRAEGDGLASSDVHSAMVTVVFDCEERSRRGDPWWRLRDYRCHSEVDLAGRVGVGGLHKIEVGLYDRWTAGWTYYEREGAAAAVEDVPELRERYAAARGRDA